MRSELTTLEKIDAYLSGNLPPDEKAAFENQLNSDPQLKAQVEQQQELIRAVNRKALRTQIAAVAAGAAGGGATSGGFSNLFLGISGGIVVGITTAAVIYFNGGDEPVTTENEQIVMNTPVIDEIDSVQTDTYIESEDGLIKEEPETIFSSVNNYEEEDEDRMNVTVHFQSRGEGAQVDYSNTRNGALVEEDNQNSEINIEIDENEVIDHARRASFPGGNLAMKNFMDKNLRYPKSAQDKSIEAVVRCDFHVTADGLITEIDAKCIQMCEKDGMPFNDVRLLMNKRLVNSFIGNATHVLRTMPEWEPAKNSQGNPIISTQRMYFNYDMERGCLVYQLDDEDM